MEGVDRGRAEDSTPNPTRRRGGRGSGLHLGLIGLALCPVACLGCHHAARREIGLSKRTVRRKGGYRTKCLLPQLQGPLKDGPELAGHVETVAATGCNATRYPGCCILIGRSFRNPIDGKQRTRRTEQIIWLAGKGLGVF